MFQKIKEKKQQFLRFLFGSFTATALMFVFQACYGMPNDTLYIYVQGTVVSDVTGEPIPNIEVRSNTSSDTVRTDDMGQFFIAVPSMTIPNLTFKDIDQAENGQFAPLDTILEKYNGEMLEIRLNEITNAE